MLTSSLCCKSINHSTQLSKVLSVMSERLSPIPLIQSILKKKLRCKLYNSHYRPTFYWPAEISHDVVVESLVQQILHCTMPVAYACLGTASWYLALSLFFFISSQVFAELSSICVLMNTNVESFLIGARIFCVAHPQTLQNKLFSIIRQTATKGIAEYHHLLGSSSR